MFNGILYQIRNLVNSMCYKGQTTQKFPRRKAHHLHLLRIGKHSNPHLQAAFTKYGEENFIFEIIYDNIKSAEELNQLEIQFISETSKSEIYNILEGGYTGSRGIAKSEITKEKISRANKGRKHSEEAKKLMSENRKNCNGIILNGDKHGRAKLTEEQVCKIKFALIGTMSQESIAKIYNVTRPTITLIATNKNWKHVTKTSNMPLNLIT